MEKVDPIISYLKDNPYVTAILQWVVDFFDYQDLSSLPYVLLKILLIGITLEAIRMIIFMLKVRTEPKIKNYVLKNPNGKRILIVGDSTAVGKGAKLAEDTIAGKLGHDFPNSEIINLGVNGCLMSDVIRQLNSVKGQKFDIVIISAGGNDIVHFTKLKRLAKNLITVLDQAIEISNHRVLLLLYSNIGYAPIFPSYIKWLLKRRTNKIHEIFQNISYSIKVPCIKLFIDPKDNEMTLKERKKLFAADMIHPSSEGYRLWYNHMWKAMIEQGYVLHEVPRIDRL